MIEVFKSLIKLAAIMVAMSIVFYAVVYVATGGGGTVTAYPYTQGK